MDETMNPLYILGWPLGYVMEWIYKLIPNYGWDIILFTLLITVDQDPPPAQPAEEYGPHERFPAHGGRDPEKVHATSPKSSRKS